MHMQLAPAAFDEICPVVLQKHQHAVQQMPISSPQSNIPAFHADVGFISMALSARTNQKFGASPQNPQTFRSEKVIW